MTDEAKFQLLTVDKETGDVESADLSEMMKSVAEVDPDIDLSGGSVTVDNDTIEGAGTPENPIRVGSGITDQLDNKLSRDYAHFKLAVDVGESETPPTLEEGENVYYTRARLEGSIKITEHIIRDHTGEETIIKTTKKIL